MRIRSWVLTAAIGATILGGWFPATARIAGSADDGYQALVAARKAQYDWQRMPAGTDAEKAAREQERRRAAEALTVAAGNFLAAFPGDARTWEALSALAGADRNFTGPTARADEIAWRAFREHTQQRLLTSEGVPDAVWENAMIGEVMRHRMAAEARRRNGEKADTAPWRAALDTLGARTPDSRMRGPFEIAYAEFLLAGDRAEGERFLRQLADGANAELAGRARGVLNVMRLETEPVELKFTAADGRKVDVSKMRGQIVLIDFWATWCVPCLKELPNTRAAYEAYKDKGVRMLGISFDHAPKDPAKPSSSDRTREQLLKDAKKLGMSWPQFYDGNGWDCELGRRYNITSIPRIWFIDKDGMLRTQHASGRKIWDLLAEHTGYTAPIPEQFREKEAT